MRGVLIFCCCLVTIGSSAQSRLDSVVQKDATKGAASKIDSTYSGLQYKLDSVKILGDSATRAALSKADSIRTDFQSKVDSLQKSYSEPLNNLNSASRRFENKVDSLNGVHSRAAKKLRRKYTTKLDSINRIQNQKVAELNHKVDKLKTKATASLKGINLPPQMQAPMNNLTQSIQGYKVPMVNGSIPMNLPPTNLLGLQIPVLGNAQVSGLNIGSNPLNGMTNGSKEISSITGEAGGIGKDLKNVSQGKLDEVKNLDKTAENQVMRTGVAGELKGKTGEVDKMKGQLGARPDSAALNMVKDEAKTELMKEARNHFKGQEAALQNAMGQMSKLKMKYSEVKSMAELPKKLPNPLKQTSFIERIIPGISFQILNNGRFLLDVNPSATYRITPRFSAGAGWLERISIGTGGSSDNRVYGPRGIFQLNWLRGFCFRFQPELVNAMVPPQLIASPGVTEGRREWVPGMFVGLKKEFNVWKRIRGNTEILYNLYTPENKSPYGDRMAVRFGFEFPLRNKNRNK